MLLQALQSQGGCPDDCSALPLIRTSDMARTGIRTALVCGAGGFIGSQLVRRLKTDVFWVRGVDLQFPQYAETAADDFVIGELRDPSFCRQIVDRRFAEVYQLAADMGG